nr:MAG TPA: hypothetical protein [Caudoviricetes sp.]
MACRFYNSYPVMYWAFLLGSATLISVAFPVL